MDEVTKHKVSIANFIKTNRPSWSLLWEDNLGRIVTNQSVLEWSIIDKIVNTFKLGVRDIMVQANGGLIITVMIRGGE